MYKNIKRAWFLSDDELNALAKEHGDLVFFQILPGEFQNTYYYIFKK